MIGKKVLWNDPYYPNGGTIVDKIGAPEVRISYKVFNTEKGDYDYFPKREIVLDHYLIEVEGYIISVPCHLVIKII